MREVVQQKPGHGDGPDVLKARRHRQVVHRGVLGVECQRDEGLEPAGVVLQGPQAQQVVDAVLIGLDVTVEHGGVGLQA